MSEIDSPAVGAFVPGRYEAEALRYMHEWEPSRRLPSKHIVAQKTGPDMFQAFVWSRGRSAWVPWNGSLPNAARRVMIDALMREAGWANLTIMDEAIDFADYAGIGPQDFDHIVFCEGYTLLCPVGVPGGGEGWAQAEVDRNGVGRPLSSGCHGRDAGGSFFLERELAARYRTVALPVEQAPLGYHQPLRVAPVLVRHDRVAREIVPKNGWGISNRPDLAARQMDRELAINAAVAAEEERQRKSGEWQQPLEQIRFEIALRMEKEWARQDVAAVSETVQAA